MFLEHRRELAEKCVTRQHHDDDALRVSVCVCARRRGDMAGASAALQELSHVSLMEGDTNAAVVVRSAATRRHVGTSCHLAAVAAAGPRPWINPLRAIPVATVVSSPTLTPAWVARPPMVRALHCSSGTAANRCTDGRATRTGGHYAAAVHCFDRALAMDAPLPIVESHRLQVRSLTPL